MAIVSGTVRLSNGELPNYFSTLSESIRLVTGDLSCEGTILGGHIFVKIEGLQEEMLDDEVLRIAGYIMDNLALTQTVTEGVGASYTLENYWKDSGLVLRVMPDQAPAVGAFGYDSRQLFALITRNAQLRYAVRDFNQGLVYPQDCPYLFYRTVETLARLVCEKDDFQSLGKKDWKLFHKRVATTYDDLKELHNFAKRQHHGSYAYFTKNQYLAMVSSARLFLSRTIQYLLAETY